ncbi:hypothetical protein HLH34_18675 [Gluconacetobacter azotocaptans]|uniref:Transmembrane protein n=1 Tax=Gluconacetobacter azotocaptans TaxID=142834 RepID=A0A7W4JWA2_9PROT|nr:hypothetical protein [Gluconacetobacter azotocaptans]MBB2191960.1 hypothetical protein [Gluconacetobacter azotocaptans]MBM9401088.1 hypothetical protein [Gluconacetobacter azotocaptans]GBQ30282.1 hypothetical protein AA13594_1679 [Gluconacetobacter azotocaptans DSM 13594]
MTIPKRVRVCADALATCGGSLSERIDRLDVRGTPDEALRAELAAVAAAWCDGGFGAFKTIDVLGEVVTIPALAASDGELRVSFIKAPTASTYYFLTARGLAVLLDDCDKAALARRVLVAEEFTSFRAVQCSFEPWTEMVADALADDEFNWPVPRRIVRDQLAIVPFSIGPLLLTVPPQPAGNTECRRASNEQDPTEQDDATGGAAVAAAAPRGGTEMQGSAVFKAWRAAALPQLLLCLVDEVWKQDDEIRVTLTGPRKRKLRAALEMINPNRDFKLVTEVADWVFNSGRDAETRHTLFVYELAREWPGDEPFSNSFADRAPGALEAAKAAFRMHVRDASKETLKSLQELRKTLADDVTRVVGQTRELTGNLWRDLLVVAAAVLGRFTLLATPGKDEAGLADALLYGLAIYLAFSLGMVIFANAQFMALFRKMQSKWQTKLYGFVDPEDFKLLAAEPLTEAENIYKNTRNAAIAAYILTISALIALAVVPVRLAQGTNNSGTAANASSVAARATDPSKVTTLKVTPLGSNRKSLAAGVGGTVAPLGTLVSGGPAKVGGVGVPNAKDTVGTLGQVKAVPTAAGAVGGPMH